MTRGENLEELQENMKDMFRAIFGFGTIASTDLQGKLSPEYGQQEST